MDFTPQNQTEKKAASIGSKIAASAGIISAAGVAICALIGGLKWIADNLPMLIGGITTVIGGAVTIYVAISRMRRDRNGRAILPVIVAILMFFILITAGVLLSGCAAPNPVQVARGISLITIYAPRTSVAISSPTSATNAAASASISRDADSQKISPSNYGVCLVMDSMFCLPNGGGTASSNNVVPTLSFTP